MDQKLDAYIESLVLTVMADPGLNILPPDQKEAYSQKLRDHFHTLIIDTLLNRLTPEQLKEVEALKDQPEKLEDKIEELAVQVPGLARDMEDRLNREVGMMKQALTP